MIVHRDIKGKKWGLFIWNTQFLCVWIKRVICLRNSASRSIHLPLKYCRTKSYCRSSDVQCLVIEWTLLQKAEPDHRTRRKRMREGSGSWPEEIRACFRFKICPLRQASGVKAPDSLKDHTGDYSFRNDLYSSPFLFSTHELQGPRGATPDGLARSEEPH